MDLYDEIARVAHELWEKRGREHGNDCGDWYQGEIIVRARYGQPEAAVRKTEKKAAKPKGSASKKSPEKSAKKETKSRQKKTEPVGTSKK